MSERAPLPYEQIVTTGRSGAYLVRMYGYGDIEAMATALPASARVLDVGAGDSNLGAEIAARRPDISWCAFDYSYINNVQAVARLRSVSPDNVRYIPGDATKMDAYDLGEFDLVLSYFMLPHLSLYGKEPARQAATNMYNAVKDGGVIAVGPQLNAHSGSLRRRMQAFSVVKMPEIPAEAFADKATELVAIPATLKRLYRAGQEALADTIGVSRQIQGKGRKAKVFDPESHDYVDVLSRPGMHVVSKVLAATARNFRGK